MVGKKRRGTQNQMQKSSASMYHILDQTMRSVITYIGLMFRRTVIIGFRGLDALRG